MWSVFALVMMAAGVSMFFQWHPISSTSHDLLPKLAPNVESSANRENVGALGRLEPLGQISKVSLPAFLKDERVASILVKEGDLVKAGQVICKMDAQKRLSREVDIAKQEVELAGARLNRVKAGAKEGEIEASRAAVQALRAELSRRLASQDAVISKARAEFGFQSVEAERYRRLQQEGAVSLSQCDSKITARTGAKANLDEALVERQRLNESITARISEAEANLRQVKEVRSVDVNIADAEVKHAEAKRAKLVTDLHLSQVTAPRDGRILRLNIRPGETVTDKGIVELGSTEQMIAVAEVYQSDVGSLRLGQKAIIRGDGIRGSVTGSVWSIGWEVLKQSVFAQDPSTASDARVVEVKVMIDKSFVAQVEKLSNMQVEVVFVQEPPNLLTGR